MLDSSMLIFDTFLYVLVYVLSIPFLFSSILRFFLKILKIKNEQNSKKIFIFSFLISICASIILSNNINLLPETRATINGKWESDLKSKINYILDLKEKKTEFIYAKTNEIDIYSETRTHRERIERFGSYKYVDKTTSHSWITIGNDKYIIPLSTYADAFRIKNLLYNGDYGEQVNSLNAIEVYKNTKLIKSVNGIDMDSDYEIIKEFAKEKEYKIKIKISEEGNLQYETEGCSLEEYLNNNKEVDVGVYNEQGDFVVVAGQLFGSKEEKLNKTFIEELNINKLAMYCYPDGRYYVCVCEASIENLKIKGNILSNAVEFRVKKRTAIDY